MSGLKVYDAWGREKKAVVAQQPVIVKAQRSTDVSSLSSGYTGPINFENEIVDTDGVWNGTRFQPNKAGWYRVASTAIVSGGTSGVLIEYMLTMNATGNPPTTAQVMDDDLKMFRSDGWMSLRVDQVLFFNGTTDYAEIVLWINGAGAALRGTSTGKTTFSAQSVAPLSPYAGGGNPPLVTALPGAGSVPDGFEVYYDPGAAASGLWRLRYSAASQKWRWVGGGMLRASAADATTTGAGSSYSPQLTDVGVGQAGCKMVLPFAGDYWVETSGAAYLTTGPVNIASGIGRTTLTGGTGDSAPQIIGEDGATSGNGMGNLFGQGVITGVAAGQTVAQFYLYAAQTVTYVKREFWARPALVS